MPMSHKVTTHRVLPFVLAIPLLLLFFSGHVAGPDLRSSVFNGRGLSGISDRLPLPIPLEDDALATGLPAPEPVGKRTARKGPFTRVVYSAEPAPVPPGFHSGPMNIPPSMMNSLAASLFLSRPPPADPGCVENGGSEGNDDVSQTLS